MHYDLRNILSNGILWDTQYWLRQTFWSIKDKRACLYGNSPLHGYLQKLFLSHIFHQIASFSWKVAKQWFFYGGDATSELEQSQLHNRNKKINDKKAIGLMSKTAFNVHYTFW